MESDFTKDKPSRQTKQGAQTLVHKDEDVLLEEPVIYRADLRDAGQFGYSSLRRTPAEESYEPRYFLDDSLLFSPYGHALPPALADLLDVAGAIMWADRTFRRPHKWGRYGKMRGRERTFELILGVRNPEVWSRPEVKGQLEDLLTWLSEDNWHLTFVQQVNIRRDSDIKKPLFPNPPSDALAVLYSGGLDSLAGTVSLLRNSERPLVLVSAVHGRLRGVIDKQVRALRDHGGKDRIQQASLPFRAVHPTKRQVNEEPTQRTRGFLFLSFGAAAAVACNASQILICENGPGSLNLPLNWRHLGSQNTRATHPRTLVWMNRLLNLIGLSDLQYEAPYLFQTKAELCNELRAGGLGRLARMTVSCDSFPLRVLRESHESEIHCGWCTSCLLRREALFAAQLETIEMGSYYQRDVCKKPKGVKLSYLEPLKNMLDQCYTIETALASPHPDQALFQSFPELITAVQAITAAPQAFSGIQKEKIVHALSGVLGRYAREWEQFPFQLFPR